MHTGRPGMDYVVEYSAAVFPISAESPFSSGDDTSAEAEPAVDFIIGQPLIEHCFAQLR